MRPSVLVVALALLVAGCAAPAATEPYDEELVRDDAGLAATDGHLEAISADIDAGWDAASEGDYEAARGHAYAAREAIQLAYGGFLAIEGGLDPADRKTYRTSFEISRTLNELLLTFCVWGDATDEFVALAEGTDEEEVDEAALVATALAAESVIESGDRLVEAVDDVATQAEFLAATDPETAELLGFDAVFVADMVALTDEISALNDELAVFVDEVAATAEDAYVPSADRDFGGGERRALPEDLVSADLAAFFDTFDANEDGGLDVAEARAFYYWVEENVEYRYDDEEEADPQPGSPVGDGRDGHDHLQTPNETYAERLGDCEDMNSLQVAFYNHWGVDAYQAFVNAEDPAELDHAIAIVRIGGTVEEFEAILGKMDYYEYTDEQGAEWGIPGGVYMIVDNAYSDDFGYISAGIEPERFTVFEIHPLGEGFDVYVG